MNQVNENYVNNDYVNKINNRNYQVINNSLIDHLMF